MPTIKLYSRKAGELPLMPCVPDEMKQFALPGYAPLSSIHNGISVLVQQYDAGDFLVRVMQITATQDDQYTIIAKPGIHLLYGLHRSTYFHLEGLNHQVFHDHGFNLLNIPLFSSLFELHPDLTFKFVAVRLSAPFLLDISSAFDPITDFLHQVERKSALRFYQVNQIASMEIIKLLDDLQYAGERNRLYNTYMRSKARELVEQSAKILIEHPTKRHARLSQFELDMMFQIKESILNNINKHFNVEGGVSLTGLTPYKIKKGFPEIYGMSVSDFAQQERIMRAKSLLENTDMPIEQVADQAGYANRKALDVSFQKSVGCTAHAYRLRCFNE